MLYNVSTGENHAQVEFVDSFPDHMMLEIWVEAHNKLGKTQSEHLSRDAGSFGKCAFLCLLVWDLVWPKLGHARINVEF